MLVSLVISPAHNRVNVAPKIVHTKINGKTRIFVIVAKITYHELMFQLKRLQ